MTAASDRFDASVVQPACSSEALIASHLTSEEQCQMAMEHCKSESMLNFYQLYFCALETSDVFFFPIGVSKSEKIIQPAPLNTRSPNESKSLSFVFLRFLPYWWLSTY